MIYFHNDYSEGCHQKVLEALTRTNLEQTACAVEILHISISRGSKVAEVGRFFADIV